MSWVSTPTRARVELAYKIEAAFLSNFVRDVYFDFDPPLVREAMQLIDFRRVQEILKPQRDSETRPRSADQIKFDGVPDRKTNDYLGNLIDQSLNSVYHFMRNAPQQMRAAQIATLYMENGATSEYERRAALVRAKENNLTRIAEAIETYEVKLLEAKAERGRLIAQRRKATIARRAPAPLPA